MYRKINIFTIYTIEDKDVMLYLLLYLKPLEEEFNISIWQNDPIYPEQLWKAQNTSRFNGTDVFILLVSNNFMQSEFIKQDEFKMILGRNEENKSIVIPILLDDFSWNTDLNSDDYNFNPSELHFLLEDGKAISDWNSVDRVFKEVIEHIKREITSFTENVGEKESSKKNEMKTTGKNKAKQIAIDFFEVRTVNAIVEKENHKEEAEAQTKVEEKSKLREALKGKKVIKRETREIKEAEIRKRIEKERKPKEKAKIEKINVEEAKAISIALEENRGNKVAKAKNVVENKSPVEIRKSGKATKLEKRQVEVVTGQKRVIKKNRLARYNYQFKTSKAVEAKRAAQEEKWENEETNAKNVVEDKRPVEIKESGRPPELEKSLGEVDVAQKRVIKKNRLARYNYQFKTSKAVEAKGAVQEKRKGSEAAKARIGAEVKSPVEITQPERTTELEKRLVELISALKGPPKKIRVAIGHYYQIITAKVVEAKRAVQEKRKGSEAAKAQIVTEAKSPVEITQPERTTELEKRLVELISALKGAPKKIRVAIGHYYQIITAKVVEAKGAVQEKRKGSEAAKARIGAEVKSSIEITRPERTTELEKRLVELISALKGAPKKIRVAIGHYYQIITAKVVEAKGAVQEKRKGSEAAKAQIGAEVKSPVEITRPERTTELEKRLVELISALKGGVKKIRLAARHNYQFKSAGEAKENPKNTNEKRRIHLGLLIAALVICGLFIYVYTEDSEKKSTTFPEIETTDVDPDAKANIKTNSVNQAAAFLKLRVGDTYEGGIIFEIDPSNKMGKTAYLDDAGPMPWKSAMKINEQLGEGWRLPTLDELRLMYQNIGQGADNRGEFADELYWSATPFDNYQARLLRFSDGNTSYHYNSTGTYRKFRVRAVRNFSR